MALLLTLDRLSPLDARPSCCTTVRLLFQEVAEALERSEARAGNSRPSTRPRARVRPRGATPPCASGRVPPRHAQLAVAFVAASRSGDLNRLRTARERRARRDRRRRQGAGRAKRARGRRARGALPDWRCAQGMARSTSPCASRRSTACPASSSTHPKARCRRPHSRLTATSSGRSTWCAIPTSCGTYSRRRGDASTAAESIRTLVRVRRSVRTITDRRAGTPRNDHGGRRLPGARGQRRQQREHPEKEPGGRHARANARFTCGRICSDT